MKTIAIYPGTFDPITNGHLDVIERAAELFSTVIVAIANNSTKQPLFPVEKRMELIATSVRHLKNVRADNFQGLLIDYARKKKAKTIVRGLRAVSDFEYEFQMALTNRKLAGELTTVFLMPHEKYTYLSSSLVKEVAMLGGDVTEFVPGVVLKALKAKTIKK